MRTTSPLYTESEIPKRVFSTKFIVASQRLNDEFLCVNTAQHSLTLPNINPNSDINDKIKNVINYAQVYTSFFYTLWGTFQFISGGLFDWYQQIPKA